MRPLNISSTSLLKSIVPGIISIFVYFSPEIISLLAGNEAQKLAISDLPQFLSPSLLILFTAITLVAGKTTNFIRLKILRVPNYFKKSVNHETNDVKSLSRIERSSVLFKPELSAIVNLTSKILLIREFGKIFDVIFSRNTTKKRDIIASEYISQNPDNQSRISDFLFSGTDFLDVETRKQIIADVREKYELNDTTNPKVFYSIVLNDISDSKSKETREIESVYISYKNTAISFVFVPIVRLYLNIPPVNGDLLGVLVLLFLFGVILLFYAGLFGIGKIYTKQILLEYHTKNTT